MYNAKKEEIKFNSKKENKKYKKTEKQSTKIQK